MDPKYEDTNLNGDIQFVSTSELSPVAGHVAVVYQNCMIVWGGYFFTKSHNSNYNCSRSSKYLYIYPYNLSGNDDVWIKYKVDKGEIPSDITAGCGLIYNDDLYIFGGNVSTRDEDTGYINNYSSNELYKLSLLTGTWMNVKSKNGLMPTERDKIAGFVSNKGLYYFGGYGPSLSHVSDRSQYLGELTEYYNDDSENNYPNRAWNNQLLHFDGNQWNCIQQHGDIPSPRAAASVTYVEKENSAYLFGGRHASTRLNDLYKFDLNTCIWTKIEFDTNIPTGRSWATLTYNFDDDYMMLYGGLSVENEALSDQYKLKIGNDQKTVNCSELLNENNNKTSRLWHTTVYVKNAFLSYAGLNSPPNSDNPCVDNVIVHKLSPESLKQLALKKVIYSKELENTRKMIGLHKMMPIILKDKFILYKMIADFKIEYENNSTNINRLLKHLELPTLFNAMNI